MATSASAMRDRLTSQRKPGRKLSRLLTVALTVREGGKPWADVATLVNFLRERAELFKVSMRPCDCRQGRIARLRFDPSMHHRPDENPYWRRFCS